MDEPTGRLLLALARSAIKVLYGGHNVIDQREWCHTELAPIAREFTKGNRVRIDSC